MRRTIKYVTGAGISIFSIHTLASAYRNKHLYRSDEKAKTLENLVVIKIWNRQEGKDVGHVAIQLGEQGEHYLSFWPNQGIDTRGKEGTLKSVKPVLHTYREDEAAEGRAPDHEIKLYLDRKEMLKEYEQIKADVKDKAVGYCLSGRAMRGDQRCMNCTTAVYKVLLAGGLDHIPFIDGTTTTPGGLRDMLKQAEVNQSKSLNIR